MTSQELEAEDLDRQLLEPAVPPMTAPMAPAGAIPAMPAAPTSALPQQARPMTDEERELAALEAEMAL